MAFRERHSTLLPRIIFGAYVETVDVKKQQDEVMKISVVLLATNFGKDDMIS